MIDLDEVRRLHGGLLFFQGYDSIGDESGYEGEEPNCEIWEVDPHMVDDYGGLLASCDQIRDTERFIKLLNSIPGLVNEIETLRCVMSDMVEEAEVHDGIGCEESSRHLISGYNVNRMRNLLNMEDSVLYVHGE